MPTQQEKLEAIRDACIKANPKRDWMGDDNGYPYQEPCRLADVLLAIGDQGLVSLSVHSAGDFGTASFIWEPIGSMKHMTWNLLNDDLRDQSPETVDFLYQLLK